MFNVTISCLNSFVDALSVLAKLFTAENIFPSNLTVFLNKMLHTQTHHKVGEPQRNAKNRVDLFCQWFVLLTTTLNFLRMKKKQKKCKHFVVLLRTQVQNVYLFGKYLRFSLYSHQID